MFTKTLRNEVEFLHDRNQMLAIIDEKSNQKIKLMMTVTPRIWSNYRSISLWTKDKEKAKEKRFQSDFYICC